VRIDTLTTLAHCGPVDGQQSTCRPIGEFTR
jgi:hypothetical protein